MFRLLTDETVRTVLKDISHGVNPNRTEIDDELADLFVDMGFLFRDYDEGLEQDVLTVNQHHELATIVQAPHIQRLLYNDAAMAALTVHIRKLYLPCVPVETLVETTGYTEEEIEDGLDVLKSFRLVRPSMVMEGKHSKESVLEDADELIQRVDALVELFDEDEREEIPVAELEAAIGELATGERNEDTVMAVKEDEFRTRVHQAAEEGIEDVTTTDNLSTLEAGTTGTVLNESSELANAFGRLQTTLIRVVQDIHEYTRN